MMLVTNNVYRGICHEHQKAMSHSLWTHALWMCRRIARDNWASKIDGWDIHRLLRRTLSSIEIDIIIYLDTHHHLWRCTWSIWTSSIEIIYWDTHHHCLDTHHVWRYRSLGYTSSIDIHIIIIQILIIYEDTHHVLGYTYLLRYTSSFFRYTSSMEMHNIYWDTHHVLGYTSCILIHIIYWDTHHHCLETHHLWRCTTSIGIHIMYWDTHHVLGYTSSIEIHIIII